MTARIVITGAPGSGKTAFIDRLKDEAALGDFLFFDELARRLLTQRPELRHRWAEFHREIYQSQVGREEQAAGRPFISDRGTVDAFAFHPETLAAVGTTLEREYARYSAVIHLGTTARLGEGFYATDDIRRESPQDALAIEQALRRAWGSHPRYRFVDACESWEHKFAAGRAALTEVMGAPPETPAAR
ncbi:hypothetical protein C3F09_09115 [candidate division GN15 bacterium]|uniref:NadR/Ttd14 AAA domain-containing protein n=1 Tax=candidate division GN15 bacterium TaxID=2072418 RepID=A0A855X4V9_9BACT|nr:MAG: hypothetical protein C3F09_09115 [candidate division GN15 bacterium]